MSDYDEQHDHEAERWDNRDKTKPPEPVSPLVAWERFFIHTDTADGRVVVRWETNDDRDWGVPTEHAVDEFDFVGDDALAKALKHCGKSRQGIGHKVYVYLDGEPVT